MILGAVFVIFGCVTPQSLERRLNDWSGSSASEIRETWSDTFTLIESSAEELKFARSEVIEPYEKTGYPSAQKTISCEVDVRISAGVMQSALWRGPVEYCADLIPFAPMPAGVRRGDYGP